LKSQQVIAITGGGSGLGRALARLYAKRGWRIAISDLSAERSADLAKELTEAGCEVLAQVCDIRKAEDLQTFVDDIVAKFGRIDVFVNNAGVAGSGSLEQTSFDDWEWMIDIDLMGVVRGCKAVVPVLRKQGFGHVVNVASIAGVVAGPMMASYNVAKAGVISLSESLRKDLSGTGVEVSVVCPSFFTSDLHSTARTLNADQQRIVTKMINKATYTADDIAAIVASAIDAKRFMVLPQKDAKLMWWFKRIAPERFHHWIVKKSRGMIASERSTPNA
jgi:NADP-dependent 3-hydroxy acid dehydrogenase YdfG